MARPYQSAANAKAFAIEFEILFVKKTASRLLPRRMTCSGCPAIR
jgi:hypothetical protein